jgi:hypothetical protein
MKQTLTILLAILLGFLSITALFGGIGLIAGFGAPSKELLKGSAFSSYLIPGLVLLFIIGGFSSVACFLLIKKHKHALSLSLLVAAFIIVFETVEIIVIGSPEGAARNLQILYLTIGFVIGFLAIILKRLIPPDKVNF